jgi:hypothetical protein
MALIKPEMKTKNAFVRTFSPAITINAALNGQEKTAAAAAKKG